LFKNPARVQIEAEEVRITMKLASSILVLFLSAATIGCGGLTQPSNTPPPNSPTVSITSPVSGANVSGTISVMVSVSSDTTSVQARLDGSNAGAAITSAPFTLSVDTTTVSNGSHVLTAVARNASGQTATSAGVSINVNNPAGSYTIGGSVINLVGTGGGLQLQDNGTDILPVNANGSFTFSTTLLSGTAYSVTVYQQPSSPAQVCAITSGSGTVTGNVTNIVVDCGHNEWTWVGGSSGSNQAGSYGTLGVASASNMPGARYQASPWTDNSGNFWLFGGIGFDSAGNSGDLNDLWKYSGGQWTWMGGSNVISQKGVYGTLQVPAAANILGARFYATTWTDAAGSLWLFGGQGFDSIGGEGFLNDLWRYNNGLWTWMGGSDLNGQPGTYGTQGTPGASNSPGSRTEAMRWTDVSGNFWLFGGIGSDSAGSSGYLNDLWEYKSGQWTWVSGSNLANQKGTYGTQGTAAPGNVPGARYDAATWADAAGNLWLFAGSIYDVTSGSYLNFNDLWKFSAGQWTWVSGSNLANQGGTYGTQGTAAAGNAPGGREGPMHWTDAAGNFWLFGGNGYDSTASAGNLNDLWKYSAGQWTWVSGSNTINPLGQYGTKGVSGLTSVPGGRKNSATWTDGSGNFWLFGGGGLDGTGMTSTVGNLNDLWKYEP
jgi:hypothetical protein